LACTEAHDVADLQRKYFPDINAQTIRTRLKTCGLNAYICCTKPLLTDAHKQKRLEWAKDHADWSADNWKAVIFSDESKFNLFGSDGHSWCWRRQGEEFDAWYTKKVVKHGGGNVIVWGCITAEGLGWISRIDGNMDAVLYVEILNNDFLGTLHDLDINKTNIYFQQDNDPKHTSKLAQDWFKKKKVDTLSWPPNSLDMSIIEHVWDYLDRRICTRLPLPRNRTELWEALVEEWGNIEEEYITRLYESMPVRVQALLDAKGGHTKY